MENKSKYRDVIDYSYVVLMLITSGSVFYFINLSAAIAYSVFFVLSFLLFAKRNKGVRFGKMGYYVPIFILIVLVNRFVFNPNVTNNIWLALIIGGLGSYFFYSSFGLLRFREVLLNCVTILTIISIIVCVLDMFRILPVSYVNIGGSDQTMFLCFCVGRGGHFDRMASIWHEPGACQIILNSVLFLYIPLIKQRAASRSQLRKLLIIAAGVIFTQSTTGLIILLFIAVLSMQRNNDKNIGRRVLSLTLAVVFIALFMGSDIIQEKFDEENTESSFIIRRQENIACLTMALEKPLVGYGIATKEFYNKSLNLDNFNSSNGLLQFAAFLGFLWLLIYLISAGSTIKKMNLQSSTFLLVILFVLLQSNEAFVEYPISYLFICRFKNYISIG